MGETQESNTIYTTRIHAAHLKKTLGDDFSVQLLTTSDLQSHVERRAKAKAEAENLSARTTIKKEVASFSGIWSWAVRIGHLTRTFPNRASSTRVLGEAAVPDASRDRRAVESRGSERSGATGIVEQPVPDAGRSRGILRTRPAECPPDWLYPMFLFAGTRTRRSEILRSRISDIDFQARSVLIREKKRVKGRPRPGACPYRDSSQR